MLQRNGLEPAIEVIGPTVIAALEFVGIALFVGNDESASMRALIMNDVQASVRPANQHNRLPSQLSTQIIAGVFDLAFVADINPGLAEYALDLEIEDRGV